MPEVDIVITEDDPIEMDIQQDEDINLLLKDGYGVKSHERLMDRDLANQHPMDAITGLNEAISRLEDAIDTLVPALSKQTQGIYLGSVNDDSTSTEFTATVPGVTELRDGLVILLKNGVVSSASGCSLDVNGLGAKKIHYSMAADSPITTVFNVNYTALLYYDSERNSGAGAWVFYYGYYTSSNTIGYQIRAQYRTLPAKSKFYRYRLLFESPDGTKYIPANTSSSTNGTSARTVNQDSFNPFGRICYYATTTAVNQDAAPGASNLWDQYNLVLGYSFNTGNQTLISGKQVWLECVPQNDGSVQLLSPDPVVQALPAADTGHVYILLGYAYDSTHIELYYDHPVQYIKNGRLRVWTGEDIS